MAITDFRDNLPEGNFRSGDPAGDHRRKLSKATGFRAQEGLGGRNTHDSIQ